MAPRGPEYYTPAEVKRALMSLDDDLPGCGAGWKERIHARVDLLFALLRLSERDQRALRDYAKGYTYKEIAHNLAGDLATADDGRVDIKNATIRLENAMNSWPDGSGFASDEVALAHFMRWVIPTTRGERTRWC